MRRLGLDKPYLVIRQPKLANNELFFPDFELSDHSLNLNSVLKLEFFHQFSELGHVLNIITNSKRLENLKVIGIFGIWISGDTADPCLQKYSEEKEGRQLKIKHARWTNSRQAGL
ncbi:unnamed protein product [Ambrosiozyma monospora]|uniref:Unnamed protein product n=1 Tax=Ambrosiozyma monospora TaxID=43982 RepID=A0ACB5TQN7_AMBMO|nr:unnamed protein product [Ambrosiozyma monospora]